MEIMSSLRDARQKLWMPVQVDSWGGLYLEVQGYL